MRTEGHVKSWNQERGFGFIEPVLGGQEIFVHVTAFRVRAKPPQVGQYVSFDIEKNPQGKKRAVDVELIRTARTRSRHSTKPVGGWGATTLLVIPAFAVLYAILSAIWRVPDIVAGCYLLLSLVSFVSYAVDKSAARSDRWRTSERSLLLIGLLGGWPGGIVAQQFLRHKSTKGSFQTMFWCTVAINVGVFVALSSPRFDAWSRVASSMLWPR